MTKLEKLQKQKREIEASIGVLSASGRDVAALRKELKTVNALISLIISDW